MVLVYTIIVYCNCQPKIEPHHQFKNEPPIYVLNMVDGSFT